jgi:hypothetical protein
LALATDNYATIANEAARVFAEFGVTVKWKFLEIAGGSRTTILEP